MLGLWLAFFFPPFRQSFSSHFPVSAYEEGGAGAAGSEGELQACNRQIALSDTQGEGDDMERVGK